MLRLCVPCSHDVVDQSLIFVSESNVFGFALLAPHSLHKSAVKAVVLVIGKHGMMILFRLFVCWPSVAVGNGDALRLRHGKVTIFSPMVFRFSVLLFCGFGVRTELEEEENPDKQGQKGEKHGKAVVVRVFDGDDDDRLTRVQYQVPVQYRYQYK